MRILARLVLALIANFFALIIAREFITGFGLTDDLVRELVVAGIFTAINLFIKPILKLFMMPVIVLTLGIGLFALNAGILKLLDFLSGDLTIEGIRALLLGTLIVSAVNFVAHLATKQKS